MKILGFKINKYDCQIPVLTAILRIIGIIGVQGREGR